MYRIPLDELEQARFALRHPDPVQLALSRAQQISETSASHVDLLQLLHLFVGVLFHLRAAGAGPEELYTFITSVSGVITRCVLETDWSRKDRRVARDMIYPFLGASFDGKNPVVYELLHALKHKSGALSKEPSLSVELLCKVVRVERDMVFYYLASLFESEQFPRLLSGLLFQMATFQPECVRSFAHPKLLTIVFRTLKREAPAVDTDDFVRLVVVLVHVLPYAVQDRVVRLADCMPDLQAILGSCLSLVTTELHNGEERSRGRDLFEQMLQADSSISQSSGGSIFERVAVLGRFSLHGVNDAADVLRDRSISELSFGSVQSNEMSVVTQQSGSAVPEGQPSQPAQPPLTHLKISAESSSIVAHPGPVFDETQPSRIAGLSVFYDPDGILGLEYEVVAANNTRHTVQLHPHGVHIGTAKVIDNSEADLTGSIDPESFSLGKPISVVFDDDELFHGVTIRRQGGVVRDLRVATSKRVTPWLLATSIGHVYLTTDAEFEIQHLDYSHFTPGFAASTMWPILTTINPVVALVVGRERRSRTHVTEIGVVVRRLNADSRPAEDVSLPELHLSLTLQVFWLLYTLFPAHTLRWLRSEAQRESQHAVIISAMLPTVRMHPRLMFSSEAELTDNAWDGWSALQILAMTRDVCGISGSKYLSPVTEAPISLPDASETAATGYVLDLGSMLRRLILEMEYPRKSSPVSPSPRSHPPATAEMPMDRPRARSSAHALVAPQLITSSAAPSRHDLVLSTISQLPVQELKRISQTLREDQNLWTALSSFVAQQQEQLRTLERIAAIEKIRCAQIQQQLVEQQKTAYSVAADLERHWSQKLVELKASYECKLKQLYDEHRTTTDDIKAEQLKLRRDMTMRMLKYDVMHRKLGDENTRFRQDMTDLRGKLSTTEEQYQGLIASSTVAGATRAAFMEQQQQLEEALDALEVARLKLVSAEEHALAVARKEMGEQLAAREALIQSLATNLLLLKSGRSHAAHDSSSINVSDATTATGTALDSGVVRMLLAELQKRPHPTEGNGTPANPPSRRRSLSAEGLDSMAFHYRSRSESTSGVAGRAADERVLLEAQERIRQLEHEVQQQAAMLEQARQESQENKQVAAARLQAMTRKESSLLAVIATLERRVVDLIRASGGTQPSIFDSPPHFARSISGGAGGAAGDAGGGRQSSFRSSTVYSVSTTASDPEGHHRAHSSHTSADFRPSRLTSTASRRSPDTSSSSSDGENESAHAVRLNSKYSISSGQDVRSDRRPTQSKDQCRQS